MKLSQFLQQLPFSEFSNLATGLSGAGEISEQKIPAVVSSINDALLRIYSKFLQDHKTVIIKKLPGQTKYEILSEFSESEGAADPYVMDATEPFTDDIIKIVSTHYTPKAAENISDEEMKWRRQPVGIKVPRTVVISPLVPDGELVYVNYRASHPIVVYEDDTDIDCPPSAYEALKAYVAYKEYAAMNTETSVAKGQEYLGLFNTICNELVDRIEQSNIS